MRVVDRLGSLQFDPLEVAGPQPRPDAAVAGRRLPARRGPTTSCTATGSCTRPTTRCCRSCRRPSCRGTGSRGTATGRRSRGDVRGARAAGRGAARPDPRARAAELHRHRAAGGHRLVLAADQPGPRDPRGALARPGSWPSRGARATARSTTSPSGCSRRTCWRGASRRASSSGTSCCRGTAATGCSARPATTRSSPGRGRTAKDRAVLPRAARRRAARSSRWRWRASGGPRFVVAGELPILDAAEAEVAAGGPMDGAGRRVPRAARPAGLGPRPAAPAVGLRLHLGGLRPAGQAALGLLRAADAVGRPAGRAGSSRGSTGRRARCGSSGLWWEDGFDPLSDARARVRGRVRRGAAGARRRSRTCAKVAMPRVARHRALAAAVRARL